MTAKPRSDAVTVYGVDFSLRSTGLASFDGTLWDTATIKSAPEDQSPGSFLSRVDDITARILNWCDPHHGGVVCMEGIAFNAKGRAVDRLHYGWWATYRAITEHHGEPYVVTATELKRLATGRGTAGKDEMLLAAARLIPDAPVRNNDEADAAWLTVAASIIDGHPVIKLPADHIKRIRKDMK